MHLLKLFNVYSYFIAWASAFTKCIEHIVVVDADYTGHVICRHRSYSHLGKNTSTACRLPLGARHHVTSPLA